MDTTRAPRSRWQRVFEVRYPFVYLGLAGLWVVSAILPWLDPAFAGGLTRAIWASVIGGALALALGAAAIGTIVMRRRGVWQSPERAPLAQESDPRLRQMP